MATDLQHRIEEDMKAALRAGDKARLGTLRLILAALKQVEVDTRKPLDEAGVLTVLDRMAKQRRESIAQFEAAGRADLRDKEQAELAVIQGYLPEPLDEAELASLIDAAIAEAGASTLRDMGKVMGILKPRLQGRADMAAVSAAVKSRLSG